MAFQPFEPPNILNTDLWSYISGEVEEGLSLVPPLHDVDSWLLILPFLLLVLVLCLFATGGSGPSRSRLYCCGLLRRDRSTVRERLDGSTYLFLCANPCRNPVLWLVGVVTSLLQFVLLLIIVSRVDANFKAVYACSSVRFQQALPAGLNMTVPLHTVFSIGADGFAWPHIDDLPVSTFNTSACLNLGQFGQADADPQTEAAVTKWAEDNWEVPSFLRFPFLQYVTATRAAFLLILFWTGGDAVNAIWCLTHGHLVMFGLVFTNVTLALLVASLQVTTWVTPISTGSFALMIGNWARANPGRACGLSDLYLIKAMVNDLTAEKHGGIEDVVPGISPIDILINSISIMLILDLDEKVFKMAHGLFYESYHSLLDHFEERRRKYFKIESLAAPEP